MAIVLQESLRGLFYAPFYAALALDAYAESFTKTGRRLVLCGDLNVAITDRDVHAKERKAKAIGQQPEERRAAAQVQIHPFIAIERY